MSATESTAGLRPYVDRLVAALEAGEHELTIAANTALVDLKAAIERVDGLVGSGTAPVSPETPAPEAAPSEPSESPEPPAEPPASPEPPAAPEAPEDGGGVASEPPESGA